MKMLISLIFSFIISSTLFAAQITIPMKLVSKNGASGKAIGYVIAKDSQYGLLFTPHLKDLPAGIHGFHVHLHPSCKNFGMAAGGHFDPAKTNTHLGPYGNGHLGDLPVLIVNKNGSATLPMLAPRLTVKEITGHALMIHADGDNHLNHPKKLGGGGKRIACGIIKKNVG